jgi:hypothetical protein
MLHSFRQYCASKSARRCLDVSLEEVSLGRVVGMSSSRNQRALLLDDKVCYRLSRPDGFQRALEIAAENEADALG